MKKVFVVLTALGCLAGAAAAGTGSAAADVVRRSVHVHHGAFGHGCRDVRIVKHGFHGREVIHKRVCR